MTIPFSGATRAVDGGLVQVVNDSGERFWCQWHGPAMVGLGWVAAFCDEFDYKVEVISTPTTIWRDLQGSRQKSRTAGIDLQHFGDSESPAQVMLPEVILLGKIGRLDLLAR